MITALWIIGWIVAGAASYFTSRYFYTRVEGRTWTVGSRAVTLFTCLWGPIPLAIGLFLTFLSLLDDNRPAKW